MSFASGCVRGFYKVEMRVNEWIWGMSGSRSVLSVPYLTLMLGCRYLLHSSNRLSFCFAIFSLV